MRERVCWPECRGRKTLRLATDEDFNGDIIRALRTRLAGLDLLRAQDAGKMHTPDPQVLEWAAAEGRVLLTHDI